MIMLYRGIMFLCLFMVMLMMPSLAFSEPTEIKEYTVHGGDTLWGISGRELNDKFLWPKIWKENQGIANPDKIYPGQIVRIPLYLLQKEKHDETAAPAIAPKDAAIKPEEIQQSKVQPVDEGRKSEPERRPLIGRNLLMASGYIADTITGVGKIDGSPEERHMFGNNDIIYVKTDIPVKVGDRFYIIRPGERVIHPTSGKQLGYIVEIRGIAEITTFEYGEIKARILQMFDDIVPGDILDTYYELTPPLTTGVFRKPDISGTVVASRSLRFLNGDHDVVYIDRGQKDGIEIGDILQTLIIGKHTVPNSQIQIINYRDTTATAIIRSFNQTVAKGNTFVKAE
jgi:hypothetical protein